MTQVNESFQLLGAQYVRKQAKQLSAQLDGIRRADDIEYVHRARVATRRLRAAMRLFRDCHDPEQRKRWRKGIRRLTKGLGDARDKDVQIEFLTGVLANLEDKSHLPGIARILVKSERCRESLQPKVVEAVDRFEATGIDREILAETKATASALNKKGVHVREASACEQVERHILTNLDGLLCHEDSLAKPEEQTRHHEMRIAAKRLRYTLEMCQPAYDGELSDVITRIKRVQSLLGDVHDCDVWVEHLGEMLQQERERIVARFGHDGPVARFQAGIDYLREERRGRRGRLFQELADYWEGLRAEGVWGWLVDTVRARAGNSVKPDLPANVSARQVEHQAAIHWRKLPQQTLPDDRKNEVPSERPNRSGNRP